MNPIRHLISIVFLFCGLTAWGGERGYDQNDMVGTIHSCHDAEFFSDFPASCPKA